MIVQFGGIVQDPPMEVGFSDDVIVALSAISITRTALPLVTATVFKVNEH
jgi:hypothetical protein